MRKSKIYCLLILVISTLQSCDIGNDMIWDIYPVNISFYVQDREGNDLLNPTTEGNILKNDIKVLYNGEEYPRDKDMSKTRAYLAVLSGLKTDKYGNDYLLIFGEFDGAKDHNDSFTIDWGDGTQDRISFIHRFEMGNNEPKTYLTEVYLNRKKMEEGFTIVK